MKILLAYRGSAPDTEGPLLANQYAKSLNAEVTVMTSLMFGDKNHAFATIEKGDLKRNLEVLRENFGSEGISCQTIISEHVEPGKAIVKYAKDEKIDLIIVGVRLRSKVGKLLLGSNAQYIILHSPCPVLTYREE